MPIITEDSTSLVLDLINANNSGSLPTPVSKDNCRLGPVTKVSVSSKPTLNSALTVGPGTHTTWINSKPIRYRRIDLAVLFRGNPLTVMKPSPVVPNGAAQNTFTLYQLLADINSQNGTAFTTDDFNNIQFTISTSDPLIKGRPSQTLTVTAKETSVGYIGTFAVRWIAAKPKITDLIPDAKQVLAGRVFPDGSLTLVGKKPLGQFQTYGLDASALKAVFATIPNPWYSPAGQATGPFIQILDWLNANTGRTNWNNSAASTDGGTCNINWNNVALPNANYPEANSTDYNQLIVLNAAADSWFTGKIYLHYNR
jgi:hypothetical protein